ncbi:hypothetical protein Tco_1293550 [Tanacetum coccineum]
MSMHAKTDSEVTSLTASSPQRSPRRPVYFWGLTPVAVRNSFLYSNIPFAVASTWISKWGGRKSTSTSIRKGEKGFDAIEEEGLYDEDGRKPIPRRCYFLAFVVGFFVLFTFFALVLWGAARPQKPVITMRIKKFYQSRKGHRIVSVNVRGVGVPLYGGGVNWSSENGKLTAPVPLNLNFTVKAKAYVLGKLVKPSSPQLERENVERSNWPETHQIMQTEAS